MIEEWRPITEFNGVFEVSNLGNVRRIWRRGPKPIKPSNSKGYLKVTLSFNGESFNRDIHRLVAVSFVQNPDDKPQVNHKDGNKRNNDATNLEWATRGENQKHADVTGLRQVFMPVATLDKETAGLIRSRAAAGEGRRELVRTYGVTLSTIGKIIRGEIWK